MGSAVLGATLVPPRIFVHTRAILRRSPSPGWFNSCTCTARRTPVDKAVHSPVGNARTSNGSQRMSMNKGLVFKPSACARRRYFKSKPYWARIKFLIGRLGQLSFSFLSCSQNQATCRIKHVSLRLGSWEANHRPENYCWNCA